MIKVSHIKNSYVIITKNLVPDNRMAAMKFDTGASITIISLETLYPGLSEAELEVCRNNLREKFRDKMLNPAPKSASGHELECIPSYKENVIMSSEKIDKLFYYIALNVGTNKILLGDDFISCCEFSHDIDGDIIINYFDENRYKKKVNEKLHMNVNEIMEICSLDLEKFNLWESK